MEWQKAAACRGKYRLFLREYEKGPIPKQILRTCAICPVQKECLKFVLKTFTRETVGIYAGLSLREVRSIKSGHFLKKCPHGTRIGYFVWDCECDECLGVLV